MNQKGIEGLPFKLLITSIILAVVLPIGYSAYDHYEESGLESYLEERVNELKEILEVMCLSSGNARTFSLDISGGTMNRVDFFAVGGPPDTGFSQMVNYSIDGEVTRHTLDGIRVTTWNNATLALSQGTYEIMLESESTPQGIIIRASI